MIRPIRRRQARPLWQGHDWSIERRDVWVLLGLVMMGGGFWELVRRLPLS